VTPSDFHDRAQPAVVYDAIADKYLVVYVYNFFPGSSSAGTPDWDIRATLLSSTGSPGAEFVVSESTNDELNPRVAVSWPLGEAPKYLVVWTDRPSVGRMDVRAALFSWGTPPSPFTLANTELQHRMDPDVAYAGFYNAFLVVYSSTGDIYAKTVAHGGTVGSEIPVAGWPDPETKPAVASCDWKNFLVAWQSQHTATNSDIYARRIRGDGVVLDAPTHVSSTALLERRAAIGCSFLPDGNVADADDEYLIAFEQQYSSPTGFFGIIGRCINDSGVVHDLFNIRPVHIGEEGLAYNPAVAGGAAGWFVAWEHQRQAAPSYLDIRARAVWQLFADGFEFGDMASWSSVTH
jgi:hypothetical protein